MQKLLVGGPLLGGNGNQTFAPLVSDPLTQDRKSERFVLLPNQYFVTVLAYKTGKRIGILLPAKNVKITAVALTTTSNGAEQQRLLVACRDGTIRVFSIADLQASDVARTMQDCGPYIVPGACYYPRQTVHVTQGDSFVKHLAVASANEDDIVVYALVASSDDEAVSDLALVRMRLPNVRTDASSTLTFKAMKKDSRLQSVDEDVKSRKNAEPFGLAISSRSSGDSIVTVASAASIAVYLEKNGEVLEPVSIDPPYKNSFSSIAVSTNQQDLACGHSSGMIRIHIDLFPRVEAYFEKLLRYKTLQQDNPAGLKIKKPPTPTTGLTVRRLHWHAHPVSSMTYDSSGGDASMLYSGADESVIATWQLSRGSSRPAEVLPRISLGGIVHIVLARSHQAESLLVFCSDNSLHLFETHNQFLRWKVQGVAAGACPSVLPMKPRILVDPLDSRRSHPNLILTGMSRAPGHVHKFDTSAQRVVSGLEVAPYNRVSRTEPGDSPMPSPTVSCSSWSSDGKEMLTIDTVPTENHAIGVCEHLESGQAVGSISTIRFWSSSEQGSYELVAARASPHGSENRISAAVLSPDGRHACTVSNDEKAFRLWRYDASEGSSDKGKSVSWVCQHKVDFPSGYSNHPSYALAFSSDASVLAVAFGSMITLWDHHNVTLLTSLRHLEDLEDTTKEIQFVQSKKLVDMVLASSSRGVSLQSPYGKQATNAKEWVWEVPKSMKDVRISNSAFVAESNLVSISLYDESDNTSKFVLIDALTGNLSKLTDSSVDFQDEAVSIAGMAPSSKARSTKDSATKNVFYVLTKKGEILVFSNQSSDGSRSHTIQTTTSAASTIPKLPRHVYKESSRKRPASVLTMADLEEAPQKKLSLDRFGCFVGEDNAAPSTSLPQLSGAFARAFVGRHLRRQEQ